MPEQSNIVVSASAIVILNFFIVLVGFETGTLFASRHGLSTGLFNELPGQTLASQVRPAKPTLPIHPKTIPVVVIFLGGQALDSHTIQTVFPQSLLPRTLGLCS
jgi:hypothetical protein